MGKSSMLAFVEDHLGGEHIVIRLSAETADFGVFADRLLSALSTHSVLRAELSLWHIEVDFGKLGIPVRVHRDPKKRDKEVRSTDDIFDVACKAAGDSKLILILDEITVLAHELQQQDPGQGLELFRSLKRARDRHQNLVMIFSGSIGLHHALSDRTPVNELRTVAIGPLLHDDAVCLARCLILGAEVLVDDDVVVAEEIATQTDGIAFYIHHVVEAARGCGGTLTPSDVRDTN